MPTLSDLKHVAAGDPILAEHINALVDAAVRRSVGGAISTNNLGSVLHGELYSVPVKVVNLTRTDLKQYEIGGIDDVAYDPSASLEQKEYFKNEIVLEVVAPDKDLHWSKFAIVQEAIPSEEIGEAKIAGASQVLLNVINEDDEYADVKDGDTTKLETHPAGGARILWKEPGTGAKWAIVRFGDGATQPVRCCLKDNHPKRGIIFEVYLGRLNPALDRWDFDTSSSNIYKAIDWWCSDTGPYPLAGARGWFIRQASDTYGSVYHVLGNFDCDSPGPCTGPGTCPGV